MAEIIWLMGAPGSGKGTNTPFILQARLVPIAQHCFVWHILTERPLVFLQRNNCGPYCPEWSSWLTRVQTNKSRRQVPLKKTARLWEMEANICKWNRGYDQWYASYWSVTGSPSSGAIQCGSACWRLSAHRSAGLISLSRSKHHLSCFSSIIPTRWELCLSCMIACWPLRGKIHNGMHLLCSLCTSNCWYTCKYRYPRPVFRMAVLFVEEKVSIDRQLARGRRTDLHNEKVRSSLPVKQNYK